MNRFYTPKELAAGDALGRSPSDFAAHTGPKLTDQVISAAQQTLGVKLPDSFLELLRECNGGFLKADRFPCEMPESWGAPYVDYDLVRGIGYEDGLDGDTGSLYMQEEWGYPKHLLWISGDGHTGLFLDYRTGGEPPVVFVDVEVDGPPIISPLSRTFAEFLGGLVESDD